MSTALGIASVTYVIKALLDKGLKKSDSISSIGDVIISLLPPDLMDVSKSGPSQLNLFMYMAARNSNWINDELPSLNSGGGRIRNPALGINLHYILTAYSSTELHSEILLGHALQILHENPVMSRDFIRQALNDAEIASLATSGLGNQIEQIRIIPEAFSTEDLSKLWSAFQSKYRPSAHYMASVVLIESSRPTERGLPVQQRLLYAEPFRKPVIERILSKKGINDPESAEQKVLEGYNLIIEGKNLDADVVYAMVGDNKIDLQKENTGKERVEFKLPAGIPAGLSGVRIVHEKMMGSPPLPHKGIESNVSPVVICPEAMSQTISNVSNPLGDYYSGNIIIDVKPDIRYGQQVSLFMNAIGGDTPKAYSFPMKPLDQLSSPPTLLANSIRIPFSYVKAGKYLLRLQVDGAESPLKISDGIYNSPSITIP